MMYIQHIHVITSNLYIDIFDMSCLYVGFYICSANKCVYLDPSAPKNYCQNKNRLTDVL